MPTYERRFFVGKLVDEFEKRAEQAEKMKSRR